MRRRLRPSGAAPDENRLPDGVAASYARYSSDGQREESISDQQRKCHEAAERNGHRILPDLEYADQAVSGTKLRRGGLDTLLRDAETGEFQVLYMHSLSRLARESVITMPTLKRLVYSFGVRIVSVSEGIDSSRDNWEVIASIMSLLHERYVKELAENVFRGQEGTVLAGLSVGDHRFGYTSVPIPGSEQARKGRNAKPRMTYVIDQATAPWVVRIFHWFVKERRSLRWITRELNRLGAPKDHRSTTSPWRHQQVSDLLACPKYVGVWPWGQMKNTRDPETGKIRQQPREAEESDRWTRELPGLRIVSDATFEKAQQQLQANYETHVASRRSNGTIRRNARGTANRAPQHLLSGLIKCGECDATFYVGGPYGKYLFCPNYHKGLCTCQTQLRRDRGERMILDEIGARILANPDWLQAVCDETIAAWRELESQVPSELAGAERRLSAVEQKISQLVDRIENGLDDSGVAERLRQRRDDQREIAKKIDQLRRARENQIPEPTADWIGEQLRQLGETLRGATPAAAFALRGLVDGAIRVREIRREGRQRFHLRGSFTLSSRRVAGAVVGTAGGRCQEARHAGQGGPCGRLEEVVIDFVDPNPLDASAIEAKTLYDQGLLNRDIAQRLGCSKSQITKLLKHWFESRGQVMPDGRARRRHQ